MPNRTIAFAHTAFLLLTALITTLLLTTWELGFPTAQHSASVWITEDAGTSDSEQVARTVERVAAEQDIAIGFTFPDLNTPGSLQHMYLAVGDPDSKHASWLESGYPSFSRAMELRVHPMDGFGDLSPRGFYLVFGPAENAQVLADALAEHGLSQTPGGSEARLWQSFLSGPLFNALAIALLVGVTAISAGVLLGSKGYGVQRLQGRSYGQILLRDLAQTARLWALALPCATVATLVFLGFYNGWNQLDFFARIALVFLGAFACVAVAVHAAVLGLVHATAILPSLKGRIPVRTTQAGAYLVRVPVLVLVLTVLGSVVHLTQTTREQYAALEVFAQTGETSHITLNGSTGFDDVAATDPFIGPWLRQADRDGQLIIADQQPPESVMPVGSPRPGFNVIAVNDTYLAEQEVLSPTGERYGAAASDGRVRVLLPQTHASHHGGIQQAMAGWLQVNTGGGGAGADVEILPTADGQTVFTYGSHNPRGLEELPFLRDPVIIALPNGAVLSDSNYVNYMTHGALLFPDPVVVEQARADPQMAEYINTVQTVHDKAASSYSADLLLLRIEAFNLAATTAVLLLTGIAACIIHVRTQAQTIFVRHISGWTFTATHRRFLALEAVIALGFVGWSTWDTLTTLRVLRDPTRHLPPEWTPTSGLEPFYAVAIAVSGLVLTLGALTFFHRRIVREGASQA